MIHNRWQKTITIDGQKTRIWYKLKDGSTHFLNANLIRVNKVSVAAIVDIIKTHKKKDIIISQMNRMSLAAPNAFKLLRTAANAITKIEYRLQKLWGFPVNKNMHRFWTLPHCSCPKMDNEDRYGTIYHIINQSCVLHGESKKCTK